MGNSVLKAIGKPQFIERYPFLFSAIVVLGVEIGLSFTSEIGFTLSEIVESPIKFIGLLVMKYCIMLAVTLTFLRIKGKHGSSE